MRAAEMAKLYADFPVCANGDRNPAAVIRMTGKHTVRICIDCAVRIERAKRKEAASAPK